MKNIDYKIDLLKQKNEEFYSQSKYYFDPKNSTLKINVDEVIFDKFNKTYNLENQIISIHLFLLRIPKDVVIPFDEYQCSIAIKFSKDNEEYVINKFQFEMTTELDKVKKRFDEIKTYIENNNLEQVLDYLLEKTKEMYVF